MAKESKKFKIMLCLYAFIFIIIAVGAQPIVEIQFQQKT